MTTQQTDMSGIVEKVRKLLALSTSSNPHEAALAAAKAQNLLAQYNLELSQIDQDKQTRYEQTTVSAGRHVWRRHLYYILTKYNFCHVLYYPDGRVILIGDRHNIEVVQHLYTYLVGQLEPMAQASYLQSERDVSPQLYKRSFFEGAVSAIHGRLRETHETFESTSAECRALVVVKGEELQKAVHQMYPNVRPARKLRQTRGDCDGYAQGVQAGRRVALHEAIAQ